MFDFFSRPYFWFDKMHHPITPCSTKGLFTCIDYSHNLVNKNAMTGNIALDVVVGLIFVYTLYSLLTTTLVELIATYFQLRARNLVRGIERMLDDDGKTILSKKFYDTPLIKYMASGTWKVYNKPSYLQARNFSKALIYILKNEAEKGEKPADRVKNALKKYKDTQTGQFLLDMLEEAEYNLDRFKLALETWYDDTMERVTGWYKRRITVITFVVGLLVATAVNVDSIEIIRRLSRDPKLREQYMAIAGQLVGNASLAESTLDPELVGRIKADAALIAKYGKDTPEFNKAVADSVGRVIALKQQVLNERLRTIGEYTQRTQHILYFKRDPKRGFIYDDWKNFLGCLATALAISFGAPFWFDLLGKIVRLRGSIGKSPNPKDDESKTA